MRYPDFIEAKGVFPQFVHVRRETPDDHLRDVAAAVRQALDTVLPQSGIQAGHSVAVAVGSRGIDRLAEMVAALCAGLKDRGARPLIVPAMGSHGGATAEGQRAVLERLGVTEAACGAPVVADMAVAELGTALGEVPLYFGRDLREADHSICLNRVKPHSKFKAPVESGLLKMLCVGMGKHAGALAYHHWALRHGWYELLVAMGQAMAARSNFRFGVAVVENEADRVCHLEAVPVDRLVEREQSLLEMAKRRFPRLPFSRLDALIVGRIGKEISGAGMDPNVTGRAFDLKESDFSRIIDATRVAVLDLTEKTAGNAIGLGNADIITEAVFAKLDYEATLINALTSRSLHKAFIPVRLPNDAKAIQACLATIGPVDPLQARVAIIRDTRHVQDFWASEVLIDELEDLAGGHIGPPAPLAFDADGKLVVPDLG
ncbi:MAG TPA: DUF362 domain-containing protein [Desulfobacteraceae bacterium]|nr:DUF362 domain-containing protein [Deltaproteobacteria bacterium]RLB97182.1 MAG: hypothetical protein DRH76_05485 [Deltaproteobacteria bacterium]HDI60323.1 DUF362 domain-containing protein [Desulfobacteraceae bacterium]